MNALTDIRLQLLARGYKIIPNRGKVPVIARWNAPDYVARDIASPTIGLRVEGGICIIDIDIDHPIAAELFAEAVRIAPGLDHAPTRYGGGEHKMALFCRTEDSFVRIASRKYDGHCVEIFGGAALKNGSCSRQFGIYGRYDETRDYQWADEAPDLLATTPDDLPLLTKAQALEICGAFERLADAAGWVSEEPKHKATTASVTPARSEVEIEQLLKQTKRKGHWHDSMLSAVASMIGKGWTDPAIFAACQDYCDGGWGDKDIAELIRSGREKWKTPDPDKVIDKIGPIVAAAIEAKGGVEPDFEPNWRERYINGRPKASLYNAVLAIEDSCLLCREDVFHNKLWLSSTASKGPVLSFLGEVTDARLLGLRVWLSHKYGLDLSEKYVRDAVIELGRENRFNPIADMLDEAEANWDGVKRLDRMAADYFNCEDTLLNSVCVRKVMIAAVARVRQPGCKFDTILVMESPEGWNKSSVWALLAGEGNFSDERIIGHATREVMEQLAGVWIHENADLAGMRKAEVETVKAFASRQVDRARPAYGHFLVEQPRHSIEVGTTNADTYLQSPTGNRRFWPVEVLKPIDLDQVKRDRLQLWGEAAHYQSHGESLVLPEELWASAGEVQESRRVIHPWEDKLALLSPVVGHVTVAGDEWRISTTRLFEHLRIEEREQKRHAKDLAEIMRILGWQAIRYKTDGRPVRGYVKRVPGTT